MSLSRGVFVTGTDTGVGKTHVSKLLADYMGWHCRTTYMKVVQTGCIRNDAGELLAPDYEQVMSGNAEVSGSYDAHVPYRFEPACSPHCAARMAGETIVPGHIRECLMTITSGMDFVVVEGAGGVLVPLSDTVYMLDLIECLALPVILVASSRLGTLNHTFLTLRVLGERGIRIAGVVVNCTAPLMEQDTFIYDDNLRTIKTRIHPIPFLELPFGRNDESIVKEFAHGAGIIA